MKYVKKNQTCGFIAGLCDGLVHTNFTVLQGNLMVPTGLQEVSAPLKKNLVKPQISILNMY